MANIDRYRPQRDYQPPIPHHHPNPARHSKSPSRRRDVPPAAPSPPTLSSRTSPPRPHSRRSAPSPSRPAVDPPSPTSVRKQWYFTPEEISSSPSILDGLSPPEDRLRRAKGVNFIVQAGILLELPQFTLWVAGVFFHRFYMRFSMVEERGGIHHYNIAATALFLANKTEENCRKTKDIIISVAKVAQKNPKLVIDEQSKEYWRWRDSILMYEESMLEALTFDLSIEHPFNPLYGYLSDIGHLHTKAIRHAAWAFASDACLTPLPLLMEAEDIAIASIFFASIYSGVKIDDISGGPWWKAVGADEQRINQATEVMRTFYTENPLRKSENPMTSGKSPVFVLDTTRRRGETISSQLSAAATPVSAGGAGDQDRGSTQSPPRMKPNGTTSHEGESAKLAPTHTNGTGNTAVLTPGTKRKSEDADGHGDGPLPSPKRSKHEQNGENGVSGNSR